MNPALSALARWGHGPSKIHYEMFDLERSAGEARAGEKLRSIYHRGQELAWDGRSVFAAALAKHGPIRLDERRRQALGRVFEVILWGELAAWRISAELAAEITPLEAKMAATAQAHDEARHFYVIHDYLEALGHHPTRLHVTSQRVLDLVLDTPVLAHKLLGMQLMVETTALAIFSHVRERGIEPVLCELLSYFERDEARHVGLGIQYLPELVRPMSRAEALAMLAFQSDILFWEVAALKVLEPDLLALGIRPQALLRRAKEKQLGAFRETWARQGLGSDPWAARALMRMIDVAEKLIFKGSGDGFWGRFEAAWASARGDGERPTAAVS